MNIKRQLLEFIREKEGVGRTIDEIEQEVLSNLRFLLDQGFLYRSNPQTIHIFDTTVHTLTRDLEDNL